MSNKYMELCQTVVEAVAVETDLQSNLIMSKSRSEEIVGARHMVIMILRNAGLYPKRIAELMGLSQRAIQFAITNFERKLSGDKLLRNNYARATKQLGKTLEITNLSR